MHDATRRKFLTSATGMLAAITFPRPANANPQLVGSQQCSCPRCQVCLQNQMRTQSGIAQLVNGNVRYGAIVGLPHGRLGYSLVVTDGIKVRTKGFYSLEGTFLVAHDFPFHSSRTYWLSSWSEAKQMYLEGRTEDIYSYRPPRPRVVAGQTSNSIAYHPKAGHDLAFSDRGVAADLRNGIWSSYLAKLRNMGYTDFVRMNSVRITADPNRPDGIDKLLFNGGDDTYGIVALR